MGIIDAQLLNLLLAQTVMRNITEPGAAESMMSAVKPTTARTGSAQKGEQQ